MFKKNKQASPGQSFLTNDHRSGKREGVSLFGRKLFIFASSAILIGLVLGGTLLGIYRFLADSEFFQIASVKIEGNRRLDSQDIQALSGVSYRANLLALDVALIEKKLLEHPWISWADVGRNLPSEIVIKIKERVPVVLVNGSGGLFFMDKQRVLFAEAHYPERLDFPVITGLEKDVDAVLAGDMVAWRKKADLLLKTLKFIRRAGRGNSSLPRQNISEIHVTESDDYILFLADRPFPIYLGRDASVKRYNRIAKVLYWLYKKKEFPDVNFIRMDYMSNKVLVGKNDAG